jgi:excisionase family DNA binding protein
MTASFVTVEQAAEHLGLHPKTVLRYIRDGRLPATRVGKSYRIVRAELDAFAGVASSQPAVVLRTTCIVEVVPIALEKAERLAAFLQSAALARRADPSPLQLQTAFDPLAGGLKVVLIGDPASVAKLLEMLQLQVEAGS